MTTALELRTRMAIHEAGQAVARHRLGLEPLCIRIVPDLSLDDGDLPSDQRSDIDTESAGAQVLSLLAGYAAERVAKVLEPGAERLGRNDFEEAAAVIELWGLPPDLAPWKSRATRMMRDPRNRKAVHALADCLLAHDMIDDRMVPLLIRYADGDVADAQMLEPLQLSGWLQLPEQAQETATAEQIGNMVHAAIWQRPA